MEKVSSDPPSYVIGRITDVFNKEFLNWVQGILRGETDLNLTISTFMKIFIFDWTTPEYSKSGISLSVSQEVVGMFHQCSNWGKMSFPSVSVSPIL